MDPVDARYQRLLEQLVANYTKLDVAKNYFAFTNFCSLSWFSESGLRMKHIELSAMIW